jgi:hypothetical protein
MPAANGLTNLASAVARAESHETPSVSDILDTLLKRGGEYGKFEDQARLTQSMKYHVKSHPKYRDLADDQKEAIDMILHKIARIVNGNPNNHDSWHDITGYSKLVADRLAGISR